MYKKYFILLIMVVGIAASHNVKAEAVSFGPVQITGVACHLDNNRDTCQFSITGPDVGFDCKGHHIHFSVSTKSGQAALSTVLSAYVAGKPISLKMDNPNSCYAFYGAPTFTQISISD